MIGHQHPDLDPGERTLRGEQIAVERIIRIAEEGLRTAISPLRHMMREAGEYRARQASHGATPGAGGAAASISGVSP